MIVRASRALAIVALGALFASVPMTGLASDGIGPGIISTFVRDPAGHPIAGALVVAEGPTYRAATTSIAGIVTMMGLPIGRYDVRVTRAGYTPYTKEVAVSSDPTASVLRVSVARSSFAIGQQIGSAIENVSLGGDVDAFASHVVETTQGAQLVPVSGTRTGVAPALLGTSADETRVELDGIPIAGGAASYAALRFRNAIGLDGIAFEEGPVVATPTVRDAIGGIVDYRTPDFHALSTTYGDFGYSSTFGAFQHVATTDTFGPLAIVADAVTGGGENRTQTLKARLNLSRATSVDVASYGSQSAATVDGADVATVAPAYAASIRTSVGTAALQVRAYGSAVSSSTTGLAAVAAIANRGIVDAAIADEDAHTHGVQGELDLPVGADSVALTFDRRTDAARYADSAGPQSIAQTFTSVGARTDLRLAKDARIEIGDEYAGGTSIAHRNDPHVAVEYEPSSHATLRASAGSSYATTPLTLLEAQPGGTAALRPETAFGYRIGYDEDLDGVDRISAAIFALHQYDRFATFAQSHDLGVALGLTRTPLGSGFGGDASLTLERARAFGALQPGDRIANELTSLSLAQIEGDPYTTVHAHLSYAEKNGTQFVVGETLLGANNALSTHAVGFVDAMGSVGLANFGQVRFGENNVFGTHVDDPLLAPYYVPHEFTVLYRYGLRR